MADTVRGQAAAMLRRIVDTLPARPTTVAYIRGVADGLDARLSRKTPRRKRDDRTA